MESKEYRENQKIQRKEFKKYRKYMWRILISILFTVASSFIFPGNLFVWLHNFLSGFLSKFIADSIVVWTQVLCMAGGVIGAVANTIKASNAKNAIDKAQDKEEDIVDSLLDQKDELLKKVDELSKEKEKVVTESKTYTKTEDYSKDSREFVEEKPKTKKIGTR